MLPAASIYSSYSSLKPGCIATFPNQLGSAAAATVSISTSTTALAAAAAHHKQTPVPAAKNAGCFGGGQRKDDTKLGSNMMREMDDKCRSIANESRAQSDRRPPRQVGCRE